MVSLGEIGNLVGGIALAGGGAFGLWQYWRSQRQQRLKWLVDLYARFYEQPNYQVIRAKLEDREHPTPIENLFADPSFINYLNLFEFVAYLVQNKEVRWQDVKAMFDWWLKSINVYPGLKQSLGDYGFEKLEQLLTARYGARDG